MSQKSLDQFQKSLKLQTSQSNRSFKCYQYGLKLLAKQDYSRYKLHQKMKEKGYENHEIEASLDLLINQNDLREKTYIEARVKGLMRKNEAPFLIQKKLAKENIFSSIKTIESIFEKYQTSSFDQLNQLIHKKMPSIWPENDKESYQLEIKILRFLFSKGHNPSEGKRALTLARQKLKQNH